MRMSIRRGAAMEKLASLDSRLFELLLQLLARQAVKPHVELIAGVIGNPAGRLRARR